MVDQQSVQDQRQYEIVHKAFIAQLGITFFLRTPFESDLRAARPSSAYRIRMPEQRM